MLNTSNIIIIYIVESKCLLNRVIFVLASVLRQMKRLFLLFLFKLYAHKWRNNFSFNRKSVYNALSIKKTTAYQNQYAQ